MVEPNVLSYFLIVLAGFGAVWSFRLFTGRSRTKISEFEYAAFSTIWGILIWQLFTWLLRARPDLLKSALDTPFTATPALFVLGVAVGGAAAICLIGVGIFWSWVSRGR